MIFARIFYFVYIGIFLAVLLLEASRLFFSSETWPYKLNRFFSGVMIASIWPLALVAPAGRSHISGLLAFVFSNSKSQVIDIQNKKSEKNDE